MTSRIPLSMLTLVALTLAACAPAANMSATQSAMDAMHAEETTTAMQSMAADETQTAMAASRRRRVCCRVVMGFVGRTETRFLSCELGPV